MLGSLNRSRSSSSSEGSCKIKSSSSARISCLVRKSTSFLFWLLHSCIMSSCSSISARVTVCLSSRVSMWLTARVLYFQNMVATGASDRALVCNSAQRLVMSKVVKQATAEPDKSVARNQTGLDALKGCSLLAPIAKQVARDQRCKKYTSTEKSISV